jgi:hypothetical protein
VWLSVVAVMIFKIVYCASMKQGEMEIETHSINQGLAKDPDQISISTCIYASSFPHLVSSRKAFWGFFSSSSYLCLAITTLISTAFCMIEPITMKVKRTLRFYFFL